MYLFNKSILKTKKTIDSPNAFPNIKLEINFKIKNNKKKWFYITFDIYVTIKYKKIK